MSIVPAIPRVAVVVLRRFSFMIRCKTEWGRLRHHEHGKEPGRASEKHVPGGTSALPVRWISWVTIG